MRRSTLGLIALFLILFSTFPALGGQADEADPSGIDLLWAIIAETDCGGPKRVVALTGKDILCSGDTLKLMLKTKHRCFAYIIHRDPQGKLALLFPFRKEELGEPLTAGKTVLIPPFGEWLTLDRNKGKESIHLLVAVKRLRGLEKSIGQLLSAPPSSQSDLSARIFDKLNRLQSLEERLATPVGKPLVIAGRIRGGNNSELNEIGHLTKMAVNLKANLVLGRTYHIDHQ